MNEQRQESPEEAALRAVRDAEAAKARIFTKPGEFLGSNTVDTAIHMDQDYLLVGSHVDEATQVKIVKGEYVDFGKLLPKDKILAEEDGHMELIMKNGRTFWSPVSETISINNFGRWEQAFRIFSDIYT